MKVARRKHNSESGFTLIEVIATVIVMGILAAFFIHFMGTAMNDSWRSVDLVADEAKAVGLMEKIIADYVELINEDPDNALSSIVAGESDYETDSDYGMPVTMQYIVFNASGDEQPDASGDNKNLKITVETPGHSLVTLLTKSRTDPKDSPVPW